MNRLVPSPGTILRSLINEILDVAKIESGSLVIRALRIARAGYCPIRSYEHSNTFVEQERAGL